MTPEHRLDRRGFLKLGAGLAAVAGLRGFTGEGTTSPAAAKGQSPMAEETERSQGRRMPVLFVGHGSPMNAIEDNEWSRGFRTLAGMLPRPKAILSISAHWFIPGTRVTGNAQPETIHDFGGFPQHLFDMLYPAPGDVELAGRVVRLLEPHRAALALDWGLDHGTWTVLHYLRPAADCPVVQLSIDEEVPAAGHVEIGRALAPLRDEGVLIMGSGNAVHNLRDAFTRSAEGDLAVPSWAKEFDAGLAQALEQHDTAYLSRALATDAGRISHPTPDHYMPLLYAAGAADGRDAVRFPIRGFDMGSISMRSVIFG